MRQKRSFTLAVDQYELLKQQMLNWSRRFSIFLFLDSNGYSSPYGKYECLLAVDPISIIPANEEDPLGQLNEWHKQYRDWMFGHISYDFKNTLEARLSSKHALKLNFPLLQFFCPHIVCYVEKDKTALIIESVGVSPEEVFVQITHTAIASNVSLPELSFRQRTDQGRYLEHINALRQHIKDGDCYEINYCSEGYCEGVSIDPLDVYNKLGSISPAPYAAYYRHENNYMLCASPERYLMKDGETIRTQPIKGTARRDPDREQDQANRERLQQSIKDRAENVMIVDLVRNDLARSCELGSVRVDELCGIYSFPQVHQMISTVTGKLRSELAFTEAIKYSFPMGSMTGAPKMKVMELIERYEQSRRELFSGTVGYISPEGDFDFNVIIRSLFYNSGSGYLSYHTGGAITYDSDPMQEWEEMRLKAWALEQIFNSTNP